MFDKAAERACAIFFNRALENDMTLDQLLKQVQEDVALLERAHEELAKEARQNRRKAEEKRKRISELRALEFRIQKLKAQSVTSNKGKSMESARERLGKIREKVAASERQARHFRKLSESVSPRRKKQPRVKSGTFDDL